MTKIAKGSKKVVKSVSTVAPVSTVANSIMENEVIVGMGMKVVFVDVKVKGMSMSKQDKMLGAEINDTHNAENGTAKVMLRKFPESFAKSITNAGQGVYQVYKRFGIPVGQHYAIPIKNYPKFDQELKLAISKFNVAVSALRDAVQTGLLVDIAKAQQGSLYNEANDLTLTDVDKTFAVLPMVWKNLRCKDIDQAMAILGDETVAAIEEAHKAAIVQAKKDSELAGVRKVSEEIRELVADITEKCGKKDIKGVQWKTVVSHIQKAIQTLPTYNVTDNPLVSETLAEMEKTIGNVKEYELKNDEAKRQELAKGASAIANKFATMFD